MVRIVREVAWALAYAHARGVVHRDIKPENIMIERGTGRVMVTDFGIARDARASGMTADGMVLGSVHYMAPERVSGGAADGRSDLYSLGVVAFQLLSGRLPFDAPQASAVLLMQATAQAPSLGGLAPGVPASLVAVVDRCLAKDPAARYPTGEALAEALDDALRQAQSGPQAVPERVLGEETAKGVWLRAAQLQADASRRIRERTAQAEEFATGLHAAVPTDGYRIGDVEAAGVEAGIAEEFIQLALAELTDEELATPVVTHGGGSRLERVMLGDVEHSLRVSRVLDARPAAVLESVGRTLPAAPWNLPFRDTIGGHPLDGGILTFSCPEVGVLQQLEASLGSNPLRYHLSALGVRELRVALQLVAGDSQRCELVVTVDIRPGVGRNAKIGAGIGMALGTIGGAAGVGIALHGWGGGVRGAALRRAPAGRTRRRDGGGDQVGAATHPAGDPEAPGRHDRTGGCQRPEPGGIRLARRPSRSPGQSALDSMGIRGQEAPMQFDAMIEILGFASGNDRAVRLVLEDGTEVLGLPTSVDLHPTAHEVFLKPSGDDETEIAISLGAITTAELV